MPLGVLLERVVQPLLREVGQRWVDGRMAIAQERLVSSLLRARLLSLPSQHPRERPAQVLFATLPGEQHELGLIGAVLQADDAGLAEMYLGTELPACELAEVVNQLGVRAGAQFGLPGRCRRTGRPARAGPPARFRGAGLAGRYQCALPGRGAGPGADQRVQ